jgi:sigma-B regulation protein RsbU (phosphoserine phosphatase)
MTRPAALLSSLNNLLFRSATFGDAFTTALAGTIDLASRRLTFASAGHPAAFIFSSAGTVQWLMSTGIPLGMLDEACYETTERLLEPDDTLVCYTDCAIETQNDQEQVIGPEGLIQMLKQLGFPAPGITCQDLYNALRHRRGERPLEDDLTVLFMRFKG